MKLRCSRLPLAFKCPGSLRSDDGEIRVEIAHEGGALGSAVHEVLAALVLQEAPDPPDVRPVALKYGVDADDLARLVSYGAHAWRAIRQYYPNPVTEQDLSYTTDLFDLIGHLDLVSLAETWANFTDYKSGYKQPDYYAQLMGYALLIFHNAPTVEQVKATLIWLRDWQQETILITRADAEAWEGELIERVVNWNGTYTAGEHCQWCPRFTECPARHALVRSALVEIADEDEANIITGASLPHIVQMYREGKLSIVKGLLKQIDDLIHAHIAATGPIDLGNGRELALVPENRDTIEPLKAWPVLTQYLDTDELAGCVKIGKTALLDAIGDKASKGQKAKAKAQVMSELEAANAVTKTEITKLRERKKEG